MNKNNDSSALLRLEGVPHWSKTLPMALQHVVAAVVGIVTPAIMVARVCKLNKEEEVLLIQAALFMSALATLLHCIPCFGKIGSRLPIFFGTSFAYVPTLLSLGAQFGIAAIFGAQAIGSLVALVFALFFKKIRILFPPVVAGTVVFSIGLSLYPTAVAYMAGGKGSANFGSAECWAVALITLAVVIGVQYFTKGVLKLSSLLCGVLAGYAVAAAFGLVSFDGVGSAQWVCLPTILPFGIKFEQAAIITMAVLVLVNCVQAVGDFTALTSGGLGRVPTDSELSGGVAASGIANFFASLFGGLPTASYSQNVGLVATTGVVNRMVIIITAAIIAVAGLVPKFGAVLTTIPPSVLGGATVVVFSSIAMTGVRILTQGGFSARSATIAGLSVAAGSGIVQVADCMSGLPQWVTTVFGTSPVTVCALLAILLNVILPKDKQAD